MPSSRFCHLVRHRFWMCAPRKMPFPANAGSMVYWGKFEQRITGGERWTFHFCIVWTSSPVFPLGARQAFTWGICKISRVLHDVYLITCAGDVGTRRIHLALVIEFFGKSTKCSIEMENKMMAYIYAFIYLFFGNSMLLSDSCHSKMEVLGEQRAPEV